jgi:hypothetical protein
MSLFPVPGSRLNGDFQAANTEKVAFLPPAVLGLAAINGKLIEGRRQRITGISRR